MFLVQKNKEALVGQSIPPDQLQKILAIMQADPVIRSIHNVQAVHLVS